MDLTIEKNTQYKARFGPDGVHFFNRDNGSNILFDEVSVPQNLWSKAPRQVSIALTNACNLSCPHCYAPKHKAMLDYDRLTNWLSVLDQNGCMGIGFGGGEPTLHPKIREICKFSRNNTRLSVSMTTHGHTLNSQLLESLDGHVHFIRVSVDGVYETYEKIRKRSFNTLLEKIKLLRDVIPFGINIVLNRHTINDLPKTAELAESIGATELLLLPEVAVGKGTKVDPDTELAMNEWISNYHGKVKLTISEIYKDNPYTCEPFEKETGIYNEKKFA